VRAISKTLSRRTGQRVEEVLELNAKAGQAMAGSVREARALAAQARAAARGRGARAKLRAAQQLEELADRCQRVVTQIQQRSRGEKIADRLVSWPTRTLARSARASWASPTSSAMWCRSLRSPPTPVAAPAAMPAGGQRTWQSG
jgi:hypothetical protein